MKSFKKFQEDDEWGDSNEDRRREKEKKTKLKNKRKKKESEKFSAFDE